MKKRFIFFTLLLLTLVGGVKFNVLNAQETITIGEESSTYGFLPTYTYYNYCVTQQIYTADELSGVNGNITSVSFYSDTKSIKRTLDVYLLNTDKNYFTGINDMVNLDAATILFSGAVDIKFQDWTTITFERPFIYEGKNLILCVYDHTGSFESNPLFNVYNSGENPRALYYYKDDKPGYDLSDINKNTQSSYTTKFAWHNNGFYCNNQVQFTYVSSAPAEPSLTVSQNSIDLGDVRMGNYWTEKPVTATVEVAYENTVAPTVTVTSNNNEFFTVSYDASSSPFNLTIGYDKTKTSSTSGTITITSGELEKTITVTAAPYTPVQEGGDVWEEPITVTFDANNSFTAQATGMHDDYILPGEAEDGNAGDAVYKFTLANDAVVTATVEGKNPIVAIYDEDFGKKDGPSKDNNNTGVQSGPVAETTFYYNFNEGSLDDFTVIDNDGNGDCWVLYDYQSMYSDDDKWIKSTAIAGQNNYIVTNDKYSITENSTFIYKIWAYDPAETVGVAVSEDKVNFETVQEENYRYSYGLTLECSLANYAGEELYIALYHKNSQGGNYYLLVDNIQLTDGSAKSRGSEAQIDGVQYPAGDYYLVAAAEGDFKLNFSAYELSAPGKFNYTTPADESVVEQTNPELTWESAEFASNYDVYLGTTSTLTESDLKGNVSTTSYKTKGLSNNTKYYWQVVAKNVAGNTAGAVYSFVTPLDIPQNVTASSNEIYPDNNNVTIRWNAITGVKGYNVYVKAHGEGNGLKHNDQLVNTNSYSLSKMDYSQNGHIVYVTAVYEIDRVEYESKPSATQTIEVTGYSDLLVKVTDTDDKGIAGATVVATGTDEFGHDINPISATTDNDGKYTFTNVLAGNYSITASKDGYIVNTVSAEGVTYNTLYTANIELLSPTDKIDDITAEIISDDEARVSWNADFDKHNVKYNVYRKIAGTETAGEPIATVTNKEFTDTDWAELSTGSYQYGVNVILRETSTQAYYCGFESGLNGWTKTGSAGASNYWGYYYQGYGCYFGGTAGTHSITSSSSSFIDLNEYNDATLKFYLKNNYGQDSPNTLTVNVKTDKSNDWTNIYTTSTYIENFTLVEISLSEYVGNSVQLQFECTATSNSYTCIDEIEIISRQKDISQIVWSSDVIKAKVLTFTNNAGDNNWENAANWDGNALPGENDNVIIAAEAHINSTVTVKNLTLNGGKLRLYENALLTVSGILTDKNDTGMFYAGSIYAYDGAQIVQNNKELKATFTMKINNPSEEDKANWANPEVMSKTGWQFIASPVKNVGFAVIATDGGLYDLYKYDGTADKEWDNYKDKNDNSFGSAFEIGVGYLASHREKTEISLFGTFNNAIKHTYNELTYSDDKELANFHLLGNPFTFDMDMRIGKAEYTDLIAGVAIVNENGGYTYVGAGKKQTTIPVGDGFFVKAIGPNPSLSYNHNNEVEPAARGSEKANSINVIATSKAGQDNVFINFAGQSEGFNKLQNFNDEIATVYVSENGKNYGIANVDENTTEVALNFDAKEMGSYTISLDVDGEFETVTLVDRFTGVETDMLVENEYSFIASADDNVNRFVIRLGNGQEPTDNGQFVYQNGEELILSIEGSVQIVDMLGRVVYSNEHADAYNRINVAEFNDATYVVRVVNEEGVKVQKVVIY